MGRVNEVGCPIILDTGAIRSAIPGRLVKKNQFTGSQMKIILGDFSVTYLEEAEVEIDCEGKVTKVKDMVLRDNTPEILLGTGHPLTRSLLAGRKPQIYDPTPGKVRAITRAQRKTRVREWVDSIAADGRDGAVSKQVVKLAVPTSSLPAGQGKGKTPKQGLVAGLLKSAIPDLTQNTSPQVEEGAEVVVIDVLTSKSEDTRNQ